MFVFKPQPTSAILACKNKRIDSWRRGKAYHMRDAPPDSATVATCNCVENRHVAMIRGVPRMGLSWTALFKHVTAYSSHSFGNTCKSTPETAHAHSVAMVLIDDGSEPVLLQMSRTCLEFNQLATASKTLSRVLPSIIAWLLHMAISLTWLHSVPHSYFSRCNMILQHC